MVTLVHFYGKLSHTQELQPILLFFCSRSLKVKQGNSVSNLTDLWELDLWCEYGGSSSFLWKAIMHTKILPKRQVFPCSLFGAYSSDGE